MRRVLLSLFVSLAMLLSQQGALQHELGHLVAPGGAQVDLDGDVVAAAADAGAAPKRGTLVCLDCLAFDHLAVLAFPTVPAAPLLATRDFWIAQAAIASRAADAPSQRARDPPRA